MAFVPSDLSSIIAHWRGEDIPSGSPVPLSWADVVSSWILRNSGTPPTYNSSAIGGLPGLVFNPAFAHGLTTTTMKSITNSAQIAIVCNMTSTATARGLACITPAASPDYLTALMAHDPYTTQAHYTYFDGKAEGARPVMATGVNTIVRIAVGRRFGGTWINGLRLRSFSGDDASTISLITKSCYVHLGYGSSAAQRFNGPICEVVMWTEPDDAMHSNWVEGYLAHKYSITLPTWHPFYAAAPTTGPFSGGGNTLAAIRHGIHMGNRGVK